jgi:hypothetical protein
VKGVYIGIVVVAAAVVGVATVVVPHLIFWCLVGIVLMHYLKRKNQQTHAR